MRFLISTRSIEFGIFFRFWNICIYMYMQTLEMESKSKPEIHLHFLYALRIWPKDNFNNLCMK
jgi:hypothetical protein